MKFITNDKIYVQRTDISTMLRESKNFQITFPEEVINEVFDKTFTCTINNRHEFIEFSNEKTIAFFKSLDYILDYDDVKDLSIEELNKLYLATDKEISKLLIEYDGLTYDEQSKKHNYYASQINLKNYKMSSINEYTLYKKGILKINMPNDLDSSSFIPEKPKSHIRTIFSRERQTHRKNR